MNSIGHRHTHYWKIDEDNKGHCHCGESREFMGYGAWADRLKIMNPPDYLNLVGGNIKSEELAEGFEERDLLYEVLL